MTIETCVCDHAFQDERYGPKRRVANETVSANPRGTLSPSRCTVCGKDIIKPVQIKKVKKVTEPDKKKKRGR